jgi:hypothetical protein
VEAIIDWSIFFNDGDDMWDVKDREVVGELLDPSSYR